MKDKIISNIVELHGEQHLIIRHQVLNIDELGNDEIAAKTLYTAISPGTEIAAYTNAPSLRPGEIYPRVVGYCNVAEIIAKGAAVTEYDTGDIILTFQSHRSVFICKKDTIIAKIPPNADLPKAATTYLFHLGYNALLKGDFKPGHNVAIIGLGVLGLATVALANLFGARVYAFSNQTNRLNLAHELGAHSTFKKDEKDVIPNILKKTNGTGIDIVVSTSNDWDDWKLALTLARRGGNICIIGFPGRTDPIPDFNPLSSQFFYDKQLSLIACGYSPNYQIDAHDIRFTIQRNCQFLLSLILENTLPAERIITSMVAWDKIEDVYIRLARRDAFHVTSILMWGQ